MLGWAHDRTQSLCANELTTSFLQLGKELIITIDVPHDDYELDVSELQSINPIDAYLEFLNSDKWTNLGPKPVNSDSSSSLSKKDVSRRSFHQPTPASSNSTPLLKVKDLNRSLEISWSAEFQGERWQLEYAVPSSTPSVFLDWQPVNKVPKLENRQFRQNIDPHEDVCFYRLSLKPVPY